MDKYYELPFKLENCEHEFKFKKISPVKLLSLSSQFGEYSLDSTEQVYTFALENIEVNLGGKWLPVKEKGIDVYWPTTIEDDLLLLQRLVAHFMENVLLKSFTKSNK